MSKYHICYFTHLSFNQQQKPTLIQHDEGNYLYDLSKTNQLTTSRSAHFLIALNRLAASC